MRAFKPGQRFGILALLGLLTSWIIAVGGCAPASNTGAAILEVEFWTMQLQEHTGYFNNLIASFEAKNPNVKIRWVDVPWSAMESKILTAVAARTAPDVVNLNPDFASQLASRNAWLDLDAKVTQDARASYLPNIWQATALNGQSFGIPWYLATGITIYNTALLKQAGINQPPKTYAELAQLAQQVKEKTGKYAFFASFVPEDSAQVLESFVQMGVKLVSDGGRAAFNTGEGKAAFEYWVNLYKKGLLPKEALTQGHQRAIELYQAGAIAMLDSGVQFLGAIAKNAPAIAKVSATSPQITGKTGKRNVAVMNLFIPRDTNQPDAALKFALFVTNDDNQLAFAKAANVLPSTIKALQDNYFKTLPGNATTMDKARVVSANQLKQASVLIGAMKDRNLLQKAIYENLQAAMLDEKTVEQALSDAAKEWDGRS